MTDDEKKRNAFGVALDTRNLEIQLFWSRSVFFWGFIAVAFAGYAALVRINSGLSLVVATFGFVCSIAWTLVNRGSKYWQEAWEQKILRLEPQEPEPLFARVEPPDLTKGQWLRGRQFSVSKVAIALSDYSVILWAALVGWELVQRYVRPDLVPCVREFGPLGFVAGSVVYIGLVLVFARSTRR
jgi:hypothetical protein